MKVFLMLIGLIFFTSVSAANFWSIRFDVWIGETSAATVGKTISLPVYVKNNGLIEDSYSVTITSNSTSVYIENPSFTIGPVKYGEVKSLPSKITFIAAADSSINVTVTSALYPPNTWSKILKIKSGIASLPEYDFFGIIQIMALVFILLLISKKV